jgi:hypothetical protein
VDGTRLQCTEVLQPALRERKKKKS